MNDDVAGARVGPADRELVRGADDELAFDRIGAVVAGSNADALAQRDSVRIDIRQMADRCVRAIRSPA